MDGWAARRAAAAWADRVLRDPYTVFLDTETTGLGRDAEVVDMAVVAGDGRVLLDTLVRPKRRIPEDATRIHGITDWQVQTAPSWAMVHGFLHPLLLGRRVVVYNAPYDRGVIDGCCAGDDLPPVATTWECAMREYARFRAEPNGRSGGYRWHKLDQACRAFGITPGGHRALADAFACRAVVAAMADQA
jgi:DNA polymerase-3 subunit epsilon